MRLREPLAAFVLGSFAASEPIDAAEVEKRLRLSLAFGGLQAQDEIESDSANVLTIVDESGATDSRIVDARSDEAYAADFAIEPGTLGTLALQYAVSPRFLIEGSAGYCSTSVGSIEVQLLHAGVFRIPAGKLERVPLQLTGLARFRPRSRVSPYVGGGFGYEVMGFTPSDALDRLSLNLDASRARQSHTLPNNSGILVPSSEPERELGPATVDAQDAWEWHAAGGAEIAFGRRWATFLDVRYSVSSRSFHLQFDGRDELGVSVPQGRTTVGSELAMGIYGGAYVDSGGLLDVDSDGDLDDGLYWATGGELRYDGISAQVGVRYTF